MPSNLVGKGKKFSEKVWQQAKQLASKSYDESEGDKFYGTTVEIAKNIAGKHGRKGRSAKKQKEDIKPAKKEGFWQGFHDKLAEVNTEVSNSIKETVFGG